eukprot:s2643_g11.t1
MAAPVRDVKAELMRKSFGSPSTRVGSSEDDSEEQCGDMSDSAHESLHRPTHVTAWEEDESPEAGQTLVLTPVRDVKAELMRKSFGSPSTRLGSSEDDLEEQRPSCKSNVLHRLSPPLLGYLRLASRSGKDEPLAMAAPVRDLGFILRLSASTRSSSSQHGLEEQPPSCKEHVLHRFSQSHPPAWPPPEVEKYMQSLLEEEDMEQEPLYLAAAKELHPESVAEERDCLD